jgi:hypothetical protein
MEVKFNLSNSEHKELVSYCNLNNLLINDIITKSFKTGFNIERYGLLNVSQAAQEKIVEKEVIKYVEIPKEIEKEVVRIEYVDREVIKEVPVEKIIDKQAGIIDNSKLEALQNTLVKIRKDNIEKDLKIKELEKKIEQMQKLNEDKKAVFLSGSNLNNKLL